MNYFFIALAYFSLAVAPLDLAAAGTPSSYLGSAIRLARQSGLKRAAQSTGRILNNTHARPSLYRPFNQPAVSTHFLLNQSRRSGGQRGHSKFEDHSYNRPMLSVLYFFFLTGFDGNTPAFPDFHSDYCSIDTLSSAERTYFLRGQFSDWRFFGEPDHLKIMGLIEAQLTSAWDLKNETKENARGVPPVLNGKEIRKDRPGSYFLIQCDRTGHLSAVALIKQQPGESELEYLVTRPGNIRGAGKALLDEWRSIAYQEGYAHLALHALPGAAGFYAKYGFERDPEKDYSVIRALKRHLLAKFDFSSPDAGGDPVNPDSITGDKSPGSRK